MYLKSHILCNDIYTVKENKFVNIGMYKQEFPDNTMLLFNGVKGIYENLLGVKMKFTCLMLFFKRLVMITEFGELIDIYDIVPSNILELHVPIKMYSLMKESTKFYDKNKILKYKAGDIVILKDCDDSNDFYEITSIDVDQIRLRGKSIENILLFVFEPNDLIKIQNDDLIRFKDCNDFFRVKDGTIYIYGNDISILSLNFETIFQIKRSDRVIYESPLNPITSNIF